MEFKQNFIERYAKLTDLDEFLKICHIPLRKSIRVNTLKATIPEIKKSFSGLKPIPWCKEGFWINQRGIGNTKEHFLGKIYVQEAASMIPPLVLSPKQDDLVLDCCAAPGSKTTQISALMKNTGLIVANELDYIRMKPLTINLERCGCINVIKTNMDARFIHSKFDKILLDAPCSGIGTIRKSPKTPHIYNPGMVKKLSNAQKGLIINMFDNLNEDGTLVYSTCTLEPEENEGVIDYLLEKRDNAKIQNINLDIKKSPTVLEFGNKTYSDEVKKCLRIWPQDNDTEGFFVAKITKN
ncbi:MAG: RsmB/NOP family class I SAM-dependent RNA methyltransferase [Candidatus Nanoarchaeia archaeon]|nr:RsmB/NOP family class I SAM-dependent RNA methyltransferase [Candidatus Nanoarchaeia archaeon]